MEIVKTHTLHTENIGQDLSFQFKGEIPPAIPDGEYDAIFVKPESNDMWRQKKVYLWFQVISPGEWVGHKFFGAFNIPSNGKFTASHKFWQWWVLAAGRRPCRVDRMSTSVFRNKVFRVRMRKVLKTAGKKDRSPAQQYSVIDDLLKVQ